MRPIAWLFAALLLSSSASMVAGCAADEADAAPAENEDEVVRAIRLEQLPSSSALRTKVEDQNTEWGDENIMNGSVSVIARKVAPAALARVDRVGKAAFNDRVKDDGVRPKGAVTAKAGEGDVQKEAARRIAIEGFVYSDNRDNLAPVERSVKALVTALGPAADIDTIVVDGRVIVESAGDDDATWRATTFVFANKRTGELVIFYAREGWV